MTVRIVRLGTPRHRPRGTRIGAVRRAQGRYAAESWFDVWYPDLSPSRSLVSKALAAKTDAEWNSFSRRPPI